MKKRILSYSNSTLLAITIIATLLALVSMDTRNNRTTVLDAEAFKSTLEMEDYAQALMSDYENSIVFIENMGQIKDKEGAEMSDVLFLTRSQGVDMYMTKTGITYVFSKAESDINELSKSGSSENDAIEEALNLYRVDMEFVDVNKDISIIKEHAVDQQYHYYTPGYPDGIHPKGYKKVTIENLYEGIDLVYYEKEGRMKYDFILKAGADAGKIQMKYKGEESIYIDNTGDLIITTPLGEIREEKPYTYSEGPGMAIESRYELKDNMVLFDIDDYDESENIIIDPVRMWATYYGGRYKENTRSICSDAAGNIYLAGRASNIDFPTQTVAGSYNQSSFAGGVYDAIILKFNKEGERVWATYYGGSDTDEGNDICTDDAGNLYVIGETASSDFPIQSLTGAYNQDTLGGDTLDAFILKFDTNGVRKWATYYGGNGLDRGFNVTTDQSNTLYVFGETRSTDFPTQSLASAYNQTTLAGSSDIFILKFDNNSVRQWATYYGGSGCDGRCGTFWVEIGGICTDNSGNLYVTGSTISSDFPTQSSPGAYYQSTLVGNYIDAFILKFNKNGIRKWATYYGGRAFDGGNDITTDDSGTLYVTGFTYSSNFPTYALPGAYNQSSLAGGSDVTILKFDSSGVRKWATCYGGNGGANEHGTGIDLDNSGSIYISGTAQAGANFPLQNLPGAYNQATQTGGYDIIILKLDSSGVRKWATYYGGNGGDRAWGSCIDASGNFYITGVTHSTDFPIHSLTGAYNQDTLGGNEGRSDLYLLRFEENYCHSWGSQLGHVYISDVGFGSLSNSSGGSDYSDFTSHSTNVVQNSSYPISLSFWKDIGGHKADWKVWIDYNIDGDFDDAGELVFSAENQRRTVVGTVTIPSNTSIGLTRMRVSVEDGDGSFGPCDVLNWGEVEDYSIDLQPNTPQPPVADFEGTPTTVTVGNSVSFTDLSLNDPTSWSWTFAGGTPANSTQQNPSVTYDTEGTYEVSLTATNAQGSDTETKVDYIIVEAPSGCTSVSNAFPDDPLTHTGTGSSSTMYDFGTPGHTDVTFVISDIGARTNGNPGRRYVDSVTVTYTDAGGTQTYGMFSGRNTSSVNVDIAGPVFSVTIELEDGYDGDASVTMSVDPDSISSCPPPAAMRVLPLEEVVADDAISYHNSNGGRPVLSISPNPTSEMLSIYFRSNGTSEIKLGITDLNGRVVGDLHSFSLNDDMTHQLDVRHLTNGIYFLHLISKDGSYSRKFVVSK